MTSPTLRRARVLAALNATGDQVAREVFGSEKNDPARAAIAGVTSQGGGFLDRSPAYIARRRRG